MNVDWLVQNALELKEAPVAARLLLEIGGARPYHFQKACLLKDGSFVAFLKDGLDCNKNYLGHPETMIAVRPTGKMHSTRDGTVFFDHSKFKNTAKTMEAVRFFPEHRHFFSTNFTIPADHKLMHAQPFTIKRSQTGVEIFPLMEVERPLLSLRFSSAFTLADSGTLATDSLVYRNTLILLVSGNNASCKNLSENIVLLTLPFNPQCKKAKCFYASDKWDFIFALIQYDENNENTLFVVDSTSGRIREFAYYNHPYDCKGYGRSWLHFVGYDGEHLLLSSDCGGPRNYKDQAPYSHTFYEFHLPAELIRLQQPQQEEEKLQPRQVDYRRGAEPLAGSAMPHAQLRPKNGTEARGGEPDATRREVERAGNGSRNEATPQSLKTELLTARKSEANRIEELEKELALLKMKSEQQQTCINDLVRKVGVLTMGGRTE